MALLRFLSGLTAILGAAAAINLLLITGDTFSQWVSVSFVVGSLAFLLWLVLLLIGAARRQQQESRSLQGFSTALSVFIFLAICIVLFAFATRWDTSWDLSEEGRAEFAAQTIQVLRGLDADVEVICFFPGITRRDVDIARAKAERFLDRCQKISWRIKPSFYDIESNVLRLNQLGIDRIPDSSVGLVVVKSGTSKRVVAIEGVDPKLTEYDFTNALINVVRGGEEKVYFLAGHHEAALDNPAEQKRTQYLSQALKAEGYGVDAFTFDLQHPSVPQDCDVLIIASPETDLFPEEVGALQEYKNRGGRLFVTKDMVPGRVENPRELVNFYSWLAGDWGIKVGADTVVSFEKGGTTDVLVTPELDEEIDPASSQGQAFKGSYNYQHPITRGMTYRMFFKVVSSVTLLDKLPEGVAAESLLQTRKSDWAETNIAALYGSGSAGPDDADLRGPVPFAVAASAKTTVSVGDTGRTRDARIVVVGDCNFLSDFEMPNNPGLKNFTLNCLAWLTESEDLIADRSGEKVQAPIVLTVSQQQTIAWITTLGTMQVILVAGLVVYMARRKYS